MKKCATLNLRINPVIKQQAEDVLKQLGIPMSTAIDMYLRQISLTGGIPFAMSLPKAPAAFNTDKMTPDELHAALKAGYDDYEGGNVKDASSAFADFRDRHK
ncbi:MAG: type II toxin-antitoxin system RelB/DinJ family antitoxin [Clostridiales bacterium]|jgi:addiction module RelB/DinJ family antitoxin|nr:type II toxin-antitoxin system RelB/DinJ family antitoxin [Clostridiales bacterium]